MMKFSVVYLGIPTGQCQSLIAGDRDFAIAVTNNLELTERDGN